MMEDRDEPRGMHDILDVLEGCATTVEQETPARWKFALRNGVEVSGLAHHDDNWLSLTSSPTAIDPARHSDGALHLLTLNGWLPGGTKFSRLGDGTMVGVLGELSLAPGGDLARRVGEICHGLMVATRVHALVFGRDESLPEPADLASHCESLIVNRSAVADGVGQWSTPQMLQLCADAGWQGHERGEDRVVVELDVPHGFRQALLTGVGNAGGLRVAVELEPCPAGAAAPCRLALGVLLLRTCGVVRLVRAAVDVTRDRIVPRLEVCFDSAPGHAELACALAALSTTCRVAADEAEAVLRDERLAHLYLATLEGSAASAPETGGGRQRRPRPRTRRAPGFNATTSRRSARADDSTTS